MANMNVRTGGLLGIELKFKDYDQATTLTSDVGGSRIVDPDPENCLNSMSRGSGPSERVGSRITCKDINIRGTLEYKKGHLAEKQTGNAGVKIFMALVLDTQTNGVQVDDPNKVFLNSSAAKTSSFRNIEFTTRFKVLKTKIFTFDPQPIMQTFVLVEDSADGVGWGGVKRSFEWYVPLKNMLTTFGSDETGGTCAEITDNSLHLLCWTDDDEHEQELRYNARLRYVG